MRLLLALGLVAATGTAPLQCGGGETELRRNETPDEALYGLAEQFRADGDRGGWRRTLEYLIERYPNGRFAKRAEQDLARAP